MKIPMSIYKNENITLYPFSKDIVGMFDSSYYGWFSDPEVTKHNSHGLTPMSQKDFDSFFESIEKKEILVWAIVDIKNQKHIGNVSLQSFNFINRSCEFAVIIGEQGFWGKGYCTQAAEFLYDHAFLKMNMERIYSGTAATNTGMLKVFNKLGMTKEGEYRNATYLNGKYENIHCYSILKSEWINRGR